MKRKKGYEMLVGKFIDFLEEKHLIGFGVICKPRDLEELLRVVLCKGLNLDVTTGDFEYEDYVNECKDYMFEDVDASTMSVSERQAFLQASLQVFNKVLTVGEYK